MAGIDTMEVEQRNSRSNLPDEILHHILSFLNLTDLSRLRVLSRKFQTLSTTAPSYSFSQPPYHRNCSCTLVFNFMNTLFQHRPHAFKIHKLCFSSICKKDEHRSLHEEWINKLFQTFRVDKLYLYCQLPSIFGSLSRFQSLKVLKLNMRGIVSVKLPTEIKVASLETLHVILIDTEDPIGDWVSQSFPSLKILFLSHIDLPRLSTKQLDLEIRSSCLEDLSIQYCCTFKAVKIITENLRALSYVNCFVRDCPHTEIEVEISAPNLQILSLKGAPTRLCYDERTFKSLQVANFTELRFLNLNLSLQLFEAIRWATLLHVDTFMLKDLYGNPSISFGNVCHLEILVKRSFFDYEILSEERYNYVGDVLITFLEGIPNLETLTLVNSKPLDILDEELLKECMLWGAVRMCVKRKWKKIKGVKKVKFRITTMNHSMVLLIDMLKTYCVDLEEMTLNYPSCYHESIKLYLNCLDSASFALAINLVSLWSSKQDEIHTKKCIH